MSNDGVLVVFTAKTVEQILEVGGTQSWVLNPQSMRGVRYVVCTRNSDRKHDEECGPRPEQHNSAFLVGEIAGLKKVGHESGRDRYLVQFSKYALVSVPHFRAGSLRNPVTYSDVQQCRSNRLDIEKLDFRPMPPRVGTSASPTLSTEQEKAGLSIAEAKAGLSIFYGVPPESIEITIRG
jgi:hypothetical protein